MREIKFRAWDSILQGYYKSSLDLSLNTEGKYSISSTNRFVIEQYTGLHDKNGNEIYEGDIDSRGFVVEYLINMSGYYLMKNGEGFHLAHDQSVLDGKLNHIEIVGNVHQNPELLEAL